MFISECRVNTILLNFQTTRSPLYNRSRFQYSRRYQYYKKFPIHATKSTIISNQPPPGDLDQDGNQLLSYVVDDSDHMILNRIQGNMFFQLLLAAVLPYERKAAQLELNQVQSYQVGKNKAVF